MHYMVLTHKREIKYVKNVFQFLKFSILSLIGKEGNVLFNDLKQIWW